MLCKCECGKKQKVKIANLLSGRCTECKSCIAKRRPNTGQFLSKHRLTNSKLYGIWSGIRGRCKNPNSPNYKHYGGREVKICAGWDSDFMNFYMWANSNGYKEGLQIDRVDNDGNYSCGKCEECIENGWVSNCRWTTPKKNSRNKRNNHTIKAFGEEKTMAEWAEDSRCVVNYRTLKGRIRKNIELEIALTTPAIKSRFIKFSEISDSLESNHIKINEDIAREIRKMFCNNFSIREIYTKFGITRKAVSHILHGKRWKDATKNDGLQDKIDSIGNERDKSISLKTIEKVELLLKTEKYTQDEIGRIVGISQAKVSKIKLRQFKIQQP